LLAPYVSIQDTLVARALKNSQLICGKTYAYFGDRTQTDQVPSFPFLASLFTHLAQKSQEHFG
jgi:hypothetical protein